jgi:hypothetical protein
VGEKVFEVMTSGLANRAWREVQADLASEAALAVAGNDAGPTRVVVVCVADGHSTHWTVADGRIVSRPEYIGDGVYASADPQAGTVTLTTERGDRTETIVLGAAMLAEVVALARRYGVTK